MDWFLYDNDLRHERVNHLIYTAVYIRKYSEYSEDLFLLIYLLYSEDLFLLIYLLYLKLVYKIFENNSTHKHQQNLIKI